MSNLPIGQQAALYLIIFLFASFMAAAITIGIANYLEHLKAKRALKYNKSAADQIDEQIRGLKK